MDKLASRRVILRDDRQFGGLSLQEDHPNAFPDTASHDAVEVMMGDIVQTADDHLELSIEVAAHAPIERIEIRNGTEVVELFRPYTEKDLGSRVRVLWSGAEYRGRGDRKSTRLNSSHVKRPRMPSSA